MSLLFDLPKDIHNEVCSDWLVMSDLGRLDCAMCNIELRKVFVRQLTSKTLNASESYRSLKFLNWINVRGINLSVLCLNRSLFDVEGIFRGAVALDKVKDLEMTNLDSIHVQAFNSILLRALNTISIELGHVEFDVSLIQWPLTLLRNLQSIKMNWCLLQLESLETFSNCSNLKSIDIHVDCKGLDYLSRNFKGLQRITLTVDHLQLSAVSRLIHNSTKDCTIEITQIFPGVVMEYSSRDGYSKLFVTRDKRIDGMNEFLRSLRLNEVYLNKITDLEVVDLCSSSLAVLRLGKYSQLTGASLVYILSHCSSLIHLEISVSGSCADFLALLSPKTQYMLKVLVLRVQGYSLASLVTILDVFTFISKITVHSKCQTDEQSELDVFAQRLMKQDRSVDFELYVEDKSVCHFLQDVNEVNSLSHGSSSQLVGSRLKDSPFTQDVKFTFPKISTVLWTREEIAE